MSSTARGFVVAFLAGGGEGVGVAGDLDASQLPVCGEELTAGQGEVGLAEGRGGQVEAAGLGGVGALVDVLEVAGGSAEAFLELLGLGEEPLDSRCDAGGAVGEPVGAALQFAELRPKLRLSFGDPPAAGLCLAKSGRELVEPVGEAAVTGGEPVRAGGRSGQPGQKLISQAGVDLAQALTGTLAGRVGGADRIVLEGLDDHPETVDGHGDLVVGGAESGGQGSGTVAQLAGSVGCLVSAVGGLSEPVGDEAAAVAELPRALLGFPGASRDLAECVTEVAGG